MLIQTNGTKNAHFLFSFGKHVTTKDFEYAKSHAEYFKPHVFANEWSNGAIKDRKKTYTEINTLIHRARHNLEFRKKLLEYATKPEYSLHPEWHVGIMRWLVDSPRLVYEYPVEAHDVPEFTERGLEAVLNKRKESVKHTSRGEIDTAINILTSGERVYAENERKRHNIIINNMITYIPEVIDIFSKLNGCDPLRVFVRFGHAHISLYDEAKELYGNQSNIQFSKVVDEPNRKKLPHDDLLIEHLHNRTTDDSIIYRVLAENIMWTSYDSRGIKDSKDRLYEKIITIANLLTPKDITGVIQKNKLAIEEKDIQNWSITILEEFEKIVGYNNK